MSLDIQYTIARAAVNSEFYTDNIDRIISTTIGFEEFRKAHFEKRLLRFFQIVPRTVSYIPNIDEFFLSYFDQFIYHGQNPVEDVTVFVNQLRVNSFLPPMVTQLAAHELLTFNLSNDPNNKRVALGAYTYSVANDNVKEGEYYYLYHKSSFSKVDIYELTKTCFNFAINPITSLELLDDEVIDFIKDLNKMGISIDTLKGALYETFK